jgi:hypothetical protein
LVGLRWGPEGVAAAWTLSYWILTLPAFSYAGRPINFGIALTIGAIWKYTLASLLAAFASYEFLKELHPWIAVSGALGVVVRIATATCLFTSLYLAIVILLHRGIAPLQQVSRLFLDILPSGNSSQASDRLEP